MRISSAPDRISSETSAPVLLAPPDHGSVCSELDILAGVIGDRRRWRTMPWMVVLFGMPIIPLGIVSVSFAAAAVFQRSHHGMLGNSRRCHSNGRGRAGHTVRNVALGVWIALSAFFLVGGAAVGKMLNTAIGLILVGLSLPRGTRSLGGSVWGTPPLFDDFKN